MRTRTLLLLSVATGLLILLAGGVLLFQLSNEQERLEPSALGEPYAVGDVTITVMGTQGVAEDFEVEIVIGGVDDPDGLDNFALVTGDRRLTPIAAPADGRCAAITIEVRTCVLAFDASAAQSSSRVLVMRRGDQQRNWTL